MRRCEVLIVGGGPAGASAAILLARARRSVILLEKAAFPRRKVCGEFIAAAGVELLRSLGLGERFVAASGPEIRRIAVWAGAAAFEARMPQLRAAAPYPRALEREALDALLVERAAQCGAEVLQPAMALALERRAGGLVCRAAARRGAPGLEIEARAVIAAHGSWEPGGLATQPPHLVAAPTDLLAFQAHFRNAALPPNTIVLVPFSGGYAGLVERAAGGVTFACCLRRDALERMHAAGLPAGENLLRHALSESRGLRRALACAAREGPWLAAGPLRPGARPLYRDGVFVIGNAAGEAHPVVGEGITGAMHSAALLCKPLLAALECGYSRETEHQAARAYARRWRRNFTFRLWAAARFAELAMRPSAAAFAERLLGYAPALLTLAARMSGKARPIAG